MNLNVRYVSCLLTVLAMLGLPLAQADDAADGAAGTDGGAAQDEPCLLNPTPASQERPFDTDRPTKSNIPYTVPCGHFQYETDIFNYAYQYVDDSRVDTLLLPNPTLKLGVSQSADLEINIAPYASVVTKDLRTGRSSTLTGPGDLYTRLKVNLWGNNSGGTAMALIPYVKAPVAPIGIGNGATEGGLIAPLSVSLPASFTLLFDPEIDVLKDATRAGYHANYANLVNLSRAMTPSITVYVEYWADVDTDPQGTVHQYSIDWAVAWQPRANLQFDVGMNAGLNASTPADQLYVGASQRF